MRRTLAVTLCALWALTGLPGTAHAGGPTSVLITEPSTGQSAALYYTSGAYADLDRILGAAATSPAAESPVSGGVYYNVTWLIHDVQPWRLDTVRITGDGSAYLATRVVPDRADAAQGQTWREVANPEELIAVLDRAFAGAGQSSTSASRPEVDQQPQVTPEPTTRWFSLTGWRWAVPGVLAGLLVALVAARRGGTGEPRRALVDRAPERAGT